LGQFVKDLLFDVAKTILAFALKKSRIEQPMRCSIT